MSNSWLYDAVTKLDAGDKGYEKGYTKGKQAAAEQIFADIDRLHLHVANEYEARAYENLKKKYGVN